ncbi:type I-E CRISPR-associated protein Cas7/Cse4/CasC [Denitratisoma oestradiolicum]|uniref:CRISPR-associated protein Cas7/Cse4/CasC, subtype I-E n=1 Tax=Denitratisoma oestradiolicum TaxID=311182 RepID=A0A6S6XQ91_9PROT|nr:type I-E CRISPR-associated protein Cas7/Cse4/CasC [Denitratisoma oestradiolicum]TWO79532.1 type I-E CRISPR-associated protein Cas7/Cse4/CasC [Denitratisoma oestradiolicum]CAB1368081.1 CRISPR-associated protein Cas7/Cse4/CasC, subtype I-E [Denitratisoma oestradiolicum]
MTQFVQLHLLVSYPPANPNRDDAGKPKTAMMGGVNRMRISSQSLKRAWRTSSVFDTALAGHLGIRTKRLGEEVRNKLLAAGMVESKANELAAQVAGEFGKLKKDSVEIEQLCHVTPEEQAAVDALATKLAAGETVDEKVFSALVKARHKSADVALFGRMLAAKPDANTEAAAQVANAITVHAVMLEDDFFTAVDDLNTKDDTGAGHMGETPFAAGLFYLYLCIDTNLLLENLQGDKALAATALDSLLEAAATISPSGMQNRFGNRVRASYIRAERGSQQPRSLSVAFLKPVAGKDMLDTAIKCLEGTAQNMDAAYGACVDASQRLIVDTEKTEGSLTALKAFICEVYRG